MFLLQHPIWVDEEYKERKRTFREQVTETTTVQQQQQQQQHTHTPPPPPPPTTTNTNNNNNNKPTNLLGVITFQIVLYYAFGEINLDKGHVIIIRFLERPSNAHMGQGEAQVIQSLPKTERGPERLCRINRQLGSYLELDRRHANTTAET